MSKNTSKNFKKTKSEVTAELTKLYSYVGLLEVNMIKTKNEISRLESDIQKLTDEKAKTIQMIYIAEEKV